VFYHISLLQELEELYLNGIFIQCADGFESFVRLKKLKKLIITPNFSDHNAEWGNPFPLMPKLELLVLRGVRFNDDGFQSVCRMNRLKTLNLQNCYFNNVRIFNRITELKDLEELAVDGCDITNQELIIICNLYKLTRLDISYCENITDRGFRSLAKLQHLKELNVKKCCVGKNGRNALSKLTNLKRLHASTPELMSMMTKRYFVD